MPYFNYLKGKCSLLKHLPCDFFRTLQHKFMCYRLLPKRCKMIRIDKNIFALMQYSRLIMLAGDDFRALGLIVRAWILGQTHWLKHKCIPSRYWPAELDLIIEAGFAHRDENGSVYLLGAEDEFKWLTQRSNAGKSFKNRKRNETKLTKRHD